MAVFPSELDGFEGQEKDENEESFHSFYDLVLSESPLLVSVCAPHSLVWVEELELDPELWLFEYTLALLFR